jgi:hypothetical protein
MSILPALSGSVGGLALSLIGITFSVGLALRARRGFVVRVSPNGSGLQIRGSLRWAEIEISDIESVDLSLQLIGWRRRRALVLVLRNGKRVLVGSRFGVGGLPGDPMDDRQLESVARAVASLAAR